MQDQGQITAPFCPRKGICNPDSKNVLEASTLCMLLQEARLVQRRALWKAFQRDRLSRPASSAPKMAWTDSQLSSPESFPEGDAIISQQSGFNNLKHLEILPYFPTKILPDAIASHFLPVLWKGKPHGQCPT